MTMSPMWALFEIGINIIQCGTTIYFGLMIFAPKPKFTRSAYYAIPLWFLASLALSMYSFISMPGWLPDIIPSIVIFLVLTCVFRQGSALWKVFWCFAHFTLYASFTYLGPTEKSS
jgi:hypothetical protein